MACALMEVVDTPGHPGWERLAPSDWANWLITQPTFEVVFHHLPKWVAQVKRTAGCQAEMVQDECWGSWAITNGCISVFLLGEVEAG